MMLSELLQKCKESAASKSNKGALFERVIKLYFLTDKLYSSQIEEVYLWEEFPYRTQFGAGHDIGIDIVIKTKDIFHYSDKDPMGHSEYWAVQCKFYGDENVVSKKRY